jgi:hypothetical protein
MSSYDYVIVRSSLGRVANLRELYDCRSDVLLARSLFKPESVEKFSSSTDQPGNDIDYIESDSVKENFEMLDIDGSLKLSVLSGALKLEGSQLM